MITTNYELLSPRNRAIKEIKYMLYNYYKIDELIDKRKEELIDNMNLSTASWLRGINQDLNTFEDVIAGFDDDWKIRRYRHWQDFLRNLFAILEKFESSKYFVFLQLKYFNDLPFEEISKKMNVTEDELKVIANYFNCIVYKYAIKDKLFKEEVQNCVAV